MPHMKWPPKVVRTDILGEVKDVNGRKIARDIGRPVHLGGNTYYAFGDTFCHNDKGGFVGAQNNTIAYVPNIQQPTISQYLEKNPHVSPFVPHTISETQWENETQHKQNNDRVTCWSFGGIIEDSPGASSGWAFFDKIITHGGDIGHHFGMGVVRVNVYDGHNIRAERKTGDNMIFGPDEPRFGSITHLCDDNGWVYLLGSKDVKPPWDMRNHWARIQRGSDFTSRANYEFLLASGQWGKWSGKHDDLKRIEGLDVQSQGAIIKCPELAPEGKPYMYFGVNKFMVGHLYVGCSASLTDGWQIESAGELPRLLKPDSQRYCCYPHQYSIGRTDQGQMLCSWSDNGQFGGMVCMAVFNFDLESGQKPPPPPIPHVSKPYSHMAHPKSGFKDDLKSVFQGLFKQEGR